MLGRCLRIRIDLVEKSATIALIENAGKAPWMLLERLDVLNLDHQNIPRFRCFNLKRASQVVNLGEVNVFHIVSAIIVLDLATRPVNAFNFDDFAIFYSSIERD